MTSPALRIEDVAPDFEAETQLGHFKFSEYAHGSWVVFFSHPREQVRSTVERRAAPGLSAPPNRN